MTLEYVSPTGGGITLVVFSSIFIPVTFLVVICRLWARQLLNRKLEFNDYAIVVGGILAIANAVLMILAVVYGGVGRHQKDVIPFYPTLAKITLALALVWTLANTFVKLSIVHFYMVIFPTRIFLTCGYCITNCVQNLLTCTPVAFNWDKNIPGGHCSVQKSPFLASAIINMSLDVIIVSLPMPMLWSLQMNLRKRVSLIVIFGIGAFICILSAVRIESIANLDYTDFSYSVVPDGVYSVLEPCLGTISACLPVLQPVVNKLSRTQLFTLRRVTTRGDTTTELTADNPSTFRGSGKHNRFRRLDQEPATSQDDQYPNCIYLL